jgi:glycosyltransferase involved in cell wall biosynthesis
MFGLPLPLILGTYVAKWPSDDPVRNDLFANARLALGRASRSAVTRFQESQAAAFLVTTPAALSRFSSSEVVAERVFWLPHGIDTSAFARLPAEATAEKTILFLANVAVKKGIFTLLDAFEIVRQEIPEARLVVAGDGASLADVRRRVASMESRASIRIAGPVSRSDVPQLMANAAVYCLPSFGEPYATTVIEAMACAKPVVVTDSGGLPDMISDAGGRRVPTGNARQLAAALVEILSSRSLQESMGAHNRAAVERDYDWLRVVERLEAIYGGVLDKASMRK